MKIHSCLLGFALLCDSLAHAAQPDASSTYDITVQDNSGIERQTLVIPFGGEVQRLKMAAGFIEIQPATSGEGAARLKLYVQKNGEPFLVHSAEISDLKKVKVAYSLCDGEVTFYSPRPANLAKCSPAAVQ
jgi:hypothetical protein